MGDLTLGECRHCTVPCGTCPDVIRSMVRTAEARASHANDQLTAALKALVACASHLTTLGRPDLSPIGDYADLIECPRCEGQKYDRGSCSLCRNVGMLNAAGEAIWTDAEHRESVEDLFNQAIEDGLL